LASGGCRSLAKAIVYWAELGSVFVTPVQLFVALVFGLSLVLLALSALGDNKKPEFKVAHLENLPKRLKHVKEIDSTSDLG